MRVALVHDYIREFGGAERVLLALSEIWPEAPIYTAFYRKGSPAWERFKDRDIRVSWAHHVPFFSTKLHSPLRFLAPAIWNSFSLREYDIVISSASWYITKGFGTRGTERKNPIEICYCHTPPRWLYGYATSKEWQRYAPIRAYAAAVGFFMRQYDFRAAQRVDHFIANSEETARRIKKFYRREATVIYPTIESQKSKVKSQKSNLSKKNTKSYYLVVGRLAQSKNIELAILAANSEKFPLHIVGTGPDEARLKQLAGPTVTFMGYQSDEKVRGLYGEAKAFLALASDEDFGMTPVEAMAEGTPVVAYRGGGYVESVVDGKTGVLFDELTTDGLLVALDRLETVNIEPKDCIRQAEKFSKERFVREMKKFVTEQI